MKKRLSILVVLFAVCFSLPVTLTTSTHAQCGCSCGMQCGDYCAAMCYGCTNSQAVETALECCIQAREATGPTAACPAN